ncbi:DUF993 family protein [Thermopolyspora sp. NPDC052614]|uniref:DUF993 family protein n=1 Tax=Thermopolyspora sp. NPDC052614 TaxID=3155682 RepID=UPI00342210B0
MDEPATIGGRAMTARLLLPGPDGRAVPYRMSGVPVPAPPRPCPPPRSRAVYAAAHVVPDPRGDARTPIIDWAATLRFRHHLWSLGLGVAEAMDTAQRGQGLPPALVDELIRRTAAEAASVGGEAVYGVATDGLPPGPASWVEIADEYLRRMAVVEDAGGRAVLMASRRLAATAAGPDDYLRVYDKVISAAGRPVVLHWLGVQFDPELRGYWGADDFAGAARTVLNLIETHRDRVHGIKLSVLSAPDEEWLRDRLPAGVRLFTGDDYNYVRLIRGSDGRGSDALLGVFDPLAVVARRAFERLDAGDEDGFTRLLEPTVPLARHVFGPPTFDYKTGVVFLAWLSGHQPGFRMLGGMEAARSVPHLAEAFRLADRCGAFPDPDLAAHRMRLFLQVAGVPQ